MNLLKTFLNKDLLKEISINRSYLMGIAILMVIVYHFFCWVINPLGRLNIGFVGVDIFLFLSGLGLSYSYSKNTLRQFYKNRLKRIYPIYFIAVTITYFFVDWSFFDLLKNYITIGFYTDCGVNRYDWYLESLFTLYIFFPLFYYFSKYKYYALSFLLIIVTAILYFFDVAWYYDCFIARFPIFLYGIIFKIGGGESAWPVSLIGILLFLPCSLFISSFLGTSLITLPCIICSLYIAKYIPKSIELALNLCGQYSLELYCTNCLIYLIYKSIEMQCSTLFLKTVVVILLQIVFSIIFIAARKIINKFIK